jgi:hypothetical protein
MISRFLSAVCAFLFLGGGALTVRAQPAQGPPPDMSKYVTREEYERVLKRLDTVTTDLEKVKAQQAIPNASAKDTDEALEEVRGTVRDIQDQLKSVTPGTHQFLVTGFGFFGFEDHRGSASSFTAGVNPLILWKIGDRLIFETEFEVELAPKEEGGGTEFNMEIADLSYIVNDHLILGGGIFKTPLGIFNERLESKWINKLPDRPLPYDDERGIAQEATVGIFAKGAFDTRIGKFNYAVYGSNGPTLNTEGDNVGTLDFDNFVDENDNKAVGGRIGWLPACIPGFEVGYSAQFAKVNPPGFENVHAFTQAVDVSYLHICPQLKGQFDVRFEWVFSNVDKATYTINGAPSRFNNDRNAGYAQVAYRPTLVADKTIKNLEFVFRYDRLNVASNAPDGGFEQRYTFGLDYWLNTSTVLKTAYEVDDKEHGKNADAFFIQGAMGF